MRRYPLPIRASANSNQRNLFCLVELLSLTQLLLKYFNNFIFLTLPPTALAIFEETKVCLILTDPKLLREVNTLNLLESNIKFFH